MNDFNLEDYFGGIGSAMLTMLQVCLLDGWAEVVRPIWMKQPYIIVFIFMPFLMICTIGVLNLAIGIIVEQTMKQTEEAREIFAMETKRDEMKAILRLTDEMFESHEQERMSKEEFEELALEHPDFADVMRKCNFPRGFELRSLHTIFDDNNDGLISKQELVNGMFRLCFNNLSQHACTILHSIGKTRNELKTHVEDQLARCLDQPSKSELNGAIDGTSSTSLLQVQSVPRAVRTSEGIISEGHQMIRQLSPSTIPEPSVGECQEPLCEEPKRFWHAPACATPSKQGSTQATRSVASTPSTEAEVSTGRSDTARAGEVAPQPGSEAKVAEVLEPAREPAQPPGSQDYLQPFETEKTAAAQLGPEPDAWLAEAAQLRVKL